METSYKVRILGVPVDGTSLILGDNMSVILNCTLPSSTLKNNHNVISYHCVRGCVAAGIIRMAHVRSENNYADILTKSISGAKHYVLCNPLMFVPMIESKVNRKGGNSKVCDYSRQGWNYIEVKCNFLLENTEHVIGCSKNMVHT